MNWSKGIIYSAMAMLGLGGLLLFLAWNGAASWNHTPAQIPYLISGGLGGTALVVGGVALAVLHSLRRDLMSLGTKLDAVVEAVRVSSSTGAFAPSAVPDADGPRVVAGRTTYHDPQCHLVEDRDDLQVMAPESARDRGLAPCRICDPRDGDATTEIERIETA